MIVNCGKASVHEGFIEWTGSDGNNYGMSYTVVEDGGMRLVDLATGCYRAINIVQGLDEVYDFCLMGHVDMLERESKVYE